MRSSDRPTQWFPLECPTGAPPHLYDSRKIRIQEPPGNCANSGSHRVPFTQLYIQLAPLYTITFPHRLDGLEGGLIDSSIS